MKPREFIEAVKLSFKESIHESKKIFFPDKNVRRQFWMILVAMFLAVYSRNLFEKIVNLFEEDFQPWYIEVIAFLVGFLILIFSFFLLYIIGLALIYVGEIFIVRGRKEPVIEEARVQRTNSKSNMDKVEIEIELVKEHLAMSRLLVSGFIGSGLLAYYFSFQLTENPIFLGILAIGTILLGGASWGMITYIRTLRKLSDRYDVDIKEYLKHF